jgi:hypothetical protein
MKLNYLLTIKNINFSLELNQLDYIQKMYNYFKESLKYFSISLLFIHCFLANNNLAFSETVKQKLTQSTKKANEKQANPNNVKKNGSVKIGGDNKSSSGGTAKQTTPNNVKKNGSGKPDGLSNSSLSETAKQKSIQSTQKALESDEIINRNGAKSDEIKLDKVSRASSNLKDKFYLGSSLNLMRSSYNATAQKSATKANFTNSLISLVQNQIKEIEQKEINIKNQIKVFEQEKIQLQTSEAQTTIILGQQIQTLNLMFTSNTSQYLIFQQVSAINSTTEEIKKLQNQIKETENNIFFLNQELPLIPDKIQALNGNIDSIKDLQNRLDSIGDNSSSNNIGISLIAGYVKNLNKVYLSQEMGLEIGKTKIGSNNSNEIEARGGMAMFANVRFGYRVDKETDVYVGFGLKRQSFLLQYIYDDLSFSTRTSVTFFNLLVGGEKEIMQNFGTFVELNYQTSLKNSDFQLTSQKFDFKTFQLKGGFRYYVDEKDVFNLFKGFR